MRTATAHLPHKLSRNCFKHDYKEANMANDQNDKTLIKLDQIDGSFTKLIPPTKATEIYLDNLQHQMRHELTSDGCSYQQIIADVISHIWHQS